MEARKNEREDGRAVRRLWGGAGLAAALALAVLFSGSAGAFGRHGHGFPERRLERLLDEVEASDEQREAIRGAMGELHELWETQREQRRESREAITAALTGDEIDRPALEALRAAQVEHFEAASQQMLFALVRVAEVLTPDQRRELAASLEEHREPRRHRGRGDHGGWH